MWIWRPVMERLVSLGDLKTGLVDIVDLLKLNALLDLQAALERREVERARNRNK